MADLHPHRALQPVISRVTVAESVYLQMRDSLVLGRFESGQMLTVGALAETFQTSPMPVREALRRLGAEGAVEIRMNGSAYVPDVTPESLDDIIRARLALEGLATELAVDQITEDEAHALSALEERHRATVELRDVYEMLSRGP